MGRTLRSTHTFVTLVFVCPFMASCGSGVDPQRQPGSAETKVDDSQTAASSEPASDVSQVGRALTISNLLPAGEMTVSVMGYHVSPRTEELIAKYKLALQNHPEWHAEFVQSQPAGKALPYHPNSGLSEGEYEQMVAGLSAMEIRKVGEARLRIIDKGKGVYGFRGEGAVSALNEVEVDARADSVRTPFGILTSREDISGEEGSPLGASSSLRWHLSSGDPASGEFVSVSFGLGRLLAENRGFIDLRAKRLMAGGVGRRADAFIQFDLPPSRCSD